MIQTEVDWHFYQDVYQSSSAYFINKRQEAELTTDALSSEVNWLQL